MEKVRFTIYPHKWVRKDGTKVTKDLRPWVYKSIKLKLDFFYRKELEGIEVRYTQNSIIILMSKMYCYPLNMLLGIQKDQPQCLKMGKRATNFLKEYKRISKF